MLYLNEKNIDEIGIDWNEVITTIEDATKCLGDKDFSQPIKPYLRYRNLKNRIIAMPAFVGGKTNTAGIKWIASFPDNIKNSIPRAHSVVVLNNADTGIPEAIINTARLSMIRTAAITGSFIKAYEKVREVKNVKVGIIGWGPIGKHHFKMINSLLKDKISKIFLYDLKKIDINTVEESYRNKVEIVNCWQDAYTDADIFITCTVSDKPYINLPPKKGSLLLNISLRDFETNIYEHVKGNIIVDDWEEVCREKTDIEALHLEKGLQEEETKSIVDVICKGCLKDYSEYDTIMFNPMGMAVYDIAVGRYYVNKANDMKVGVNLD